jgi:hypothetical protein
MNPTEVVGTAHQIHPRCQGVGVPGDRPTATCPRAQGAAERGVEPLDGRRVDPRPGAGRLENRRDRCGGPPDDPAGDAHQASSGVVRDHLAQQQPGRRHQQRPARTAGAHRIAEDPGEGGPIAGQAIDANQKTQAVSGAADHPYHGHDQAQIAVGADHPTQPEPRRDGHGHGHPEPPGDRLDVELVGLDVSQFAPPAEDVMLMEVPAVLAGPVPPGGDGAFVEAEGGDDGL